MKRQIRAWACAVAAMLAAGAPASPSPSPSQGVSFSPQPGAQVPLDAVFTDSSGRAVGLGEILGKRPAVLVLGYYGCPLLCSEMARGLVSALRELPYPVEDRCEVLFISIDPAEGAALAARKKENLLRAYGRAGGGKRWHVLTGAEPSIGAVCEAVGFRYRYLPDVREYAHASGLVLLTRTGKVSGFLPGIVFPPGELARGLERAGDGTVATRARVEPLLLLCLRYAPLSGKYGPAVMALLRVLAAGTAVAVAVGIWRLSRAPSEPLP